MKRVSKYVLLLKEWKLVFIFPNYLFLTNALVCEISFEKPILKLSESLKFKDRSHHREGKICEGGIYT